MCKAKKYQDECIDTAKADTPDVFAVYEDHDDLKFIVKVYNRVLAILYKVDRYGDIEYFEKKALTSVSKLNTTLIRRVFGFNDRSIRQFYSVSAC